MKRRSEKLSGAVRALRGPCRLRRGTTLVELMIAMLILAIVCVAWLEIIGIQSARREARRREAVERLAGMMDAFMYTHKSSASIGSFYMSPSEPKEGGSIEFKSTVAVKPVFDESASSIGYQLSVVTTANLPESARFGSSWGANRKWLVGNLYDRNGAAAEVAEPFFTLPVCLGL